MKHQLFVGHFNRAFRSIRPNVVKDIDINRVIEVLRSHCDRGEDGALLCVTGKHDLEAYDSPFKRIGCIEGDDVLWRSGYLICPWLSTGVNRRSVEFMAELYDRLDVEICYNFHII